MEEYKMAQVLKAIAWNMHCTDCPYPCESKMNSSMANCVNHWYDVLTSLDKKEDKKAVMHEAFELFVRI